MKLRFKAQIFQRLVVTLVVGCFEREQIGLQNCYAVKINVEQIFKQLSPGTEVKSI